MSSRTEGNRALAPYFASFLALGVGLSFFGPARVGRTFFFEGRVLKLGRTISFAEADMLDGKGKLLARLTTSCMVIDVEGPGLFAGENGPSLLAGQNGPSLLAGENGKVKPE